ncbi:Cu(I)-responsive transcriptional regulator [Rheinheimera aquimaris]|uniref:Cu(I)-responsive transcriptional regulator n=1 Tax=Rheinheimera aquimaris TaxID=412437 RepID=UPI001E405834|nr:Cu(I)-responsive transcriptional regulator [Rheinheimera aquimaris]MCD1596876.1 Cu(I)-responsive transcriptional regulator [Rheinheimera aquimaris]
MSTLLTIGEAARHSGLSAKMIRHYEQSGLLGKAPRTDAGYRLYNSQQLQQLGFIARARKLGFSLTEIQSLLQLWQDPTRESRSVKQLAEQHLADIDAKISELQQMRETLAALADSCAGDSKPHCSILQQLEP